MPGISPSAPLLQVRGLDVIFRTRTGVGAPVTVSTSI